MHSADKVVYCIYWLKKSDQTILDHTTSAHLQSQKLFRIVQFAFIYFFYCFENFIFILFLSLPLCQCLHSTKLWAEIQEQHQYLLLTRFIFLLSCPVELCWTSLDIHKCTRQFVSMHIYMKSTLPELSIRSHRGKKMNWYGDNSGSSKQQQSCSCHV